MAHWLLYGGTFDPIHNGHLHTARAAREALAAAGILLIPARISPHKLKGTTAASPEHRLRMIELAIAGDPTFAVDDRELQRPGPSYTFDTLSSLTTERPGDTFTLLLGADQLPKLHQWHRIAELVQLARLAILPRPGTTITDATKHETAMRLSINQQAHPAQLTFLNTPLIDISATKIRDRVRQGHSISKLVPPEVEKYIAEHGLYR